MRFLVPIVLAALLPISGLALNYAPERTAPTRYALSHGKKAHKPKKQHKAPKSKHSKKSKRAPKSRH